MSFRFRTWSVGLAGTNSQDILAQVVEAHGGKDVWDRYSSVKAKMRVEGPSTRNPGSTIVYADGIFEIDLREQSVIVDSAQDGLRMRFRPNMLAIERQGEFVETRYNPKQSFGQTPLEDWDEFHRAFVCSYSAWNIFNHPFLFLRSGFAIEDSLPIRSGLETWRTFHVEYPTWITGHSRSMKCYVGEDYLFRRQDSNFDTLDSMALSSLQLNYAEVQGIKIAMSRRLFRSDDLDRGPSATALATMEISEVRYT